jgi:SAM-dependent methyltransferase
MQSVKELEDWYGQADPWGYFTHPDDQKRKEKVLEILSVYGVAPEKTLDLGCGEGWLTKDLPGDLHGIDVSEKALSRLPPNVKRYDETSHGKLFDLVVTTGTLYPQYDWDAILGQIQYHATDWVLVAGVPGWLVPERKEIGKLIHSEEIAYRDIGNRIELYHVNP